MQAMRGTSAACGPARAPCARPRAAATSVATLQPLSGRCAAARGSRDAQPAEQRPAAAPARLAAAAAAAAALLAAAPLPAHADLVQTVPVSQVLETARPLPKQTIDKPTVWVAFIGGAIAVFGVTVLAENNEKFFPAISRANAAIAMSRKRAEQAEAAGAADNDAVDVEAAEVARQQALVEEGMAQARAKVRAQAAAATAAEGGSAGGSEGAGGAAAEGAGAGAGSVLEAQSALRSFKEQQAAAAQQPQQPQQQQQQQAQQQETKV